MSSNGNAPHPSRTPHTSAGKPRRDRDDEHFALRNIFRAFTDLPRVMGLIWSTSHWMTITMALVSLISGFLPAVSVWITRGLVDSVIAATFSSSHPLGPVWFFVVAQLVVGLVQSLFSPLSTIVQQLLRERLGNRVQSMILHKADTLDLAFFENPEFYDKLRNATDESVYKPMQTISQLFDFLKTVVTLLSMLALLLSLAWWLAVIALLTPIPSFLSSSRYGWRGYHKMRLQSPERRRLLYLIRLMTTDTYNKEIKLFNLGPFFIRQYDDVAEELYQQDKKIVIPRSLVGFGWGGLSNLANAAIYIYVALRAISGAITIGGLTMYTQAAMQVGSSFQGLLTDISGI